MSFAVDVNVLLHASDTSSPEHEAARGFLGDCASRGEVFYLGWLTVMSYLRIATHPAIFSRPLSPRTAMENVEALMALPHVRMLAEEEGFWEAYRELAGQVPIRGNLVPDAHLAALLRSHGVSTLYTRDRDFLKFDFLQAVDPFA